MTEIESPLLAGRELDALVAEKVMGVWVPPFCEKHDDERLPKLVPGSQCIPHNGHHDLMVASRYSTDIAAAWLVVEKMTEFDWSFGIWRTCGISSVLSGFCASFTRDVYPPDYVHPRKFEYRGADQTAPLAICRAALTALDTTHDDA